MNSGRPGRSEMRLRPRQLPNEVILQTLAYIHPQDIENFAVACKRFYGLSSNFLERHIERKKRYREVDDKDPLTIPFILSNPELAWYVRHLTIQRDRGFDRLQHMTRVEEESNSNYQDYYSEKNLEMLRVVCHDSTIARAIGEDRCIEQIKLGRDWPLKILLTELSPMLESIAFTGHNWWAGVAGNMLLVELSEVLPKAVIQSKELNQPFLSSLSNINLNHHQEAHPGRPQFCVPLHLVTPLLTLPALKKLVIGFGYRIGSRYSLDVWQAQPRPSSFFDLGVVEALFKNEDLRSILLGIKTFKSFHPTNTMEIPRADEAVLRYHNSSLETLEWNNFSRACAIGSLREFSVLKTVVLDIAHLFETKDYYQKFGPFNPVQWLNLKEIFPLSIETFRIRDDDDSSSLLPLEGLFNVLGDVVKTKENIRRNFWGICLGSVTGSGSSSGRVYQSIKRLRAICKTHEMFLTTAKSKCQICATAPTVRDMAVDGKENSQILLEENQFSELGQYEIALPSSHTSTGLR